MKKDINRLNMQSQSKSSPVLAQTVQELPDIQALRANIESGLYERLTSELHKNTQQILEHSMSAALDTLALSLYDKLKGEMLAAESADHRAHTSQTVGVDKVPTLAPVTKPNPRTNAKAKTTKTTKTKTSNATNSMSLTMSSDTDLDADLGAVV